MSAGGTHLHHSTFGILGLLGIGYLWNYQLGTGTGHRWGSRATATGYGIAAALTLDEFSCGWISRTATGTGRAASRSTRWRCSPGC